MARIVGQQKHRLGPEGLRMATMAAAVLLAVIAVFVVLRLIQAGLSTVLAVFLLLVVFAGLVPAKLLADQYLLGRARGRRSEDTQALFGELRRLPDSWWLFPDFVLGGSGVEFLAVGPGGLFAIEVYRWLGRDTGTAFPEKMALDLAARAAEIAEAIGRLAGVRAPGIQPVYHSFDTEGLAVGELVVHPAAADLRHIRGVLLTTSQSLLPLLRTGGPQYGVRTRSLEAEQAARLAQHLSSMAG